MRTMTTQNLLQKYLIEETAYNNAELNRFEMIGSTIKIEFEYTSKSAIFKADQKFDEIIELDILDYMTWMYNQLNKNS